MNVFDFDNTIYDGESTMDFFFFILKKKPQFIIYIPKVLRGFYRYKKGLSDLKEVETSVGEMISLFLKYQDNADEVVKEFWVKHERKLKPYFLNKITDEDMIISASPRLLLEGIIGKLGTDKLFCSEIDLEKGNITFFCFGENKAKFFKERFAGAKIDEFYSDNMADRPMMELADKAFLVTGDKIEQLNFND